MAELADKSGAVFSNIVNNDSDAVTFTVPNTPTLSVESVVATVDNSAAGADATLTITIKDQDGQVIAKKAMPSTVPAGDTGTATFALGLDDATTDTDTAANHPVGFYVADVPGGNPVAAGTHSVWMQLAYAGAGAGEDLLDVVNGVPFSSWTPKVAGVYCYMARIGFDEAAFGIWPPNEYITLDLTPLGADPPPANFWATQATTTWELNNTQTAAIYTIYAMRYMSPNDANIGAQFGLRVQWTYAGAIRIGGIVEAIRVV